MMPSLEVIAVIWMDRPWDLKCLYVKSMGQTDDKKGSVFCNLKKKLFIYKYL